MAAEPVPLFEYTEVRPISPLRKAVDNGLQLLRDQERLTAEHEPLAALAGRLADALESSSGGRGASVALLAAQFRETWNTLNQLPAPPGEVDTGMDVELVPVPLPGLADAG